MTLPADLPPLKTDELASLKSQLLRRGQGLATRLADLLAGKDVDLAALAVPAPRPGERAEERLRRFLALIDRALARAREGSYGACVDCGRFLGRVTLGERPWVERCSACEEQFERSGPPPRGAR